MAGIERVAAMAAAERPDVTLLDAPVSGRRDPAGQGQLTIFASGPEEARSRVAPLFDALGQRTIWVGAVGAGSRLKLVNNTLVAFAAEGVATSVALARRLGLETETVIEAVGGGPLVSPWLGDQDLTVVTRVLEQQAVRVVLRELRALALLADVDRLRVRARVRERLGRDQAVVEDHVGGRDQLQ